MGAMQEAMKDPAVQQQMAEMQAAMQNQGLQERMAQLKASSRASLSCGTVDFAHVSLHPYP